MAILVLQITVKQWDKGQRSAEESVQRANRPVCHPLVFPPATYVLNKQCIIDAHGDDRLGHRIRYAQAGDDTIQLDRFQLSLSDKTLSYQANTKTPARLLGSIDNHWLQCQYQWRYSVEEGGMIYWLYEDVTLNAIMVETVDRDLFTRGAPHTTCSDLD